MSEPLRVVIDAPRLRSLVTLGLCALATACGGGAAPGGPAGPVEAASEAEWAALAVDRSETLDGAPRIAVGTLELPGGMDWGASARVPLPIAFSELVVAGLLRRADIDFIERRRFTAARDAERRGQARGEGAPPAGTSRSPDLILEGGLSDFGGMAASLELRLVEPESGRVARSWRQEVPGDADPVGLARAVVGSLVAELGAMDMRPEWRDPMGSAAPAAFQSTGISTEALGAYLRGLAAEERWQWEVARTGYQAAARSADDFFEAEVLLARTARLRMGGSLAAS